ncbi:MAG: hypothetical protein GXO36_05470 [Chloroflexi bacterium]|nr:hypothetical protein [Chloroflexota bacterium]
MTVIDNKYGWRTTVSEAWLLLPNDEIFVSGVLAGLREENDPILNQIADLIETTRATTPHRVLGVHLARPLYDVDSVWVLQVFPTVLQDEATLTQVQQEFVTNFTQMLQQQGAQGIQSDIQEPLQNDHGVTFYPIYYLYHFPSGTYIVQLIYFFPTGTNHVAMSQYIFASEEQDQLGQYMDDPEWAEPMDNLETFTP